MAPTVTVIIPVYNGSAWIAEAIDSALSQSTPPPEVIVVDDGSTDGTPDVLRSCAGTVRVIRQANQGVAAARNTGLSEARGEMIAFLDADDVWHEQKLRWQLAVMASRPEIGLLGTLTYDWPGERPVIPDPRQTGGLSPDARIETIPLVKLAVKNRLATSTVLMRRTLAQRLGGFDTRLQGPEDHDYWLRAAEHTTIGKLHLPLAGYRVVPGSLSTRAATMELGMRRILQKLDERGVWKGRPLLRLHAKSYCDHSAAWMYSAAGRYDKALARMLRSIVTYPIPYSREDAGAPFARAKRLTVVSLRIAGIKPPDRRAVSPSPNRHAAGARQPSRVRANRAR